MSEAKKRVAVVTGTRAEYGLLKPVIDALSASAGLVPEVVVTGAHLSEKYGCTVREIEADGVPIAARIPILNYPSTPLGTCETTADALKLYAEYFAQSKPDAVLVLGDRYEIFAAAAAAAMLRIPLAHISGGDVTAGAADEFFRHSITKMASIHFPSCRTYADRVIRMGEEPSRVFNVGGLGDENIRKLTESGKLLSAEALGEKFGFDFTRPFLLVTYHPVTLGGDPAAEIKALLSALDKYRDYGVIFTMANADAGGEIINAILKDYCAKRADTLCVTSMGMLGYLSAMRLCAAVAGNSSSGVAEAPSFGKPVVNIGDRQKGRLRCECIIDCGTSEAEIEDALKKALSPEFAAQCAGVKSPYDGGSTAKRIAEELEKFLNSPAAKEPKLFYDGE